MRHAATLTRNDLTQGLFVSTGVTPQSVRVSANPISIAAGDFYGDGTRQVVIAQALSAGGSQFLLQIYRVLTNDNGTIATQALQLAASSTLGPPANLAPFAQSGLAVKFDATIQAASNLPQDELVVVTHAGPALILQAFRVQPSSTAPFFESQPDATRPSFRMEVKQRSAGQLEFTLQVNDAVLSHDPRLCSKAKPSITTLATSFVIDDGRQPPVIAAISVPWECVGKNPQAPSELRRR